LDTVLGTEKNLSESDSTHEAFASHSRNLADLPGPAGIPLLGNILQMDSDRFHQTLEKWADEFGSLYKIKIGRKSLLVVADPTLIGTLLRDRPDAIRRSSRTANAINDIGITGVFSDEGEEWRKQRKLVMRALTPEVIRNFFPAPGDPDRTLAAAMAKRARGRAIDRHPARPENLCA
jgi:cytochrome P450